MRNYLRAIVTLAVLVPGLAFAAGVAGTKHNLSASATGGTSADQICAYCHTPHNGLANAQAALWNRKAETTAGFAVGAKTVKGTLLPNAGAMGAYSVMCLSCHDGTTAFANVMNGNLTGTENMTSYDGGVKTKANFGSDLTGQHPVSVPYPSASATVTYNSITRTAVDGFNAAASLTKAKLYGTGASLGVECGSCHDPHNYTNGKFLRASNSNSALCLDCHNK